jgi:hypothetical protein
MGLTNTCDRHNERLMWTKFGSIGLINSNERNARDERLGREFGWSILNRYINQNLEPGPLSRILVWLRKIIAVTAWPRAGS